MILRNLASIWYASPSSCWAPSRQCRRLAHCDKQTATSTVLHVSELLSHLPLDLRCIKHLHLIINAIPLTQIVVLLLFENSLRDIFPLTLCLRPVCGALTDVVPSCIAEKTLSNDRGYGTAFLRRTAGPTRLFSVQFAFCRWLAAIPSVVWHLLPL